MAPIYTCIGVLVYIPQGPSKPPPVPSPNRFAPVAPTFFFPLMAAFDCPVATLDLLGQDSLLLGSLLHALGTVMYCATNAPLAPTMAATLLDFLWALRYHNEAYVNHSSHTTIHTVSQHIILIYNSIVDIGSSYLVGMFVRVFCLLSACWWHPHPSFRQGWRED